jgi:hypothetical protein
MGRVAITRFDDGSMRTTVLSVVSTTHTDPSPTATASAERPIGTRATILPVEGSSLTSFSGHLIAVLGLLGQCLGHHAVQALRKIAVLLLDRWRRGEQVGVHDGRVLVSLKGRDAGQALVQHTAQGVDVGPASRGLPSNCSGPA